MMDDDPTIKAVRDARHRISEMVNHDPWKLVQYFRQRQERHCERHVRDRVHPIIQITEEQHKTLDKGGPTRATLDGREVVLLKTEVYKRIKAILETERALIAAGQARGSAPVPKPLEYLPFSSEEQAALGDVAVLPGSRFEEIQALVLDDKERAAWLGAVGSARRSWVEDNP